MTEDSPVKERQLAELEERRRKIKEMGGRESVERQKKRKCYDFFMYINRPTTLPLTTIKASQKPTMGKSILGLIAYRIAKLSKAMPIRITSIDEIILLKSINRIISRVKRGFQPNANKTFLFGY